MRTRTPRPAAWLTAPTGGGPLIPWPLGGFLAYLALVLALSAWLTRGPIPGDAAVYARMAAHPWVFTQAPHGYRLLTPLLVHLLPLPIVAGFFLLTALALAGTATALCALCVRAGLRACSALAAGGLFLLSYAATFDLFDARLVDPLAYLGTTLFFLALARRQPCLAAACVLLTTLDKEWGLFLLPPLGAYLWQHAARRWPAALLGLLAPVLCYLLVRHWPGFGAGAYGAYYTPALVRRMLGHSAAALLPGLATALGATWLLAPLGWRAAPPALRRTAWLLPAVALQLAAADNTERMLAYAAPCVLPLALAALDARRAPPPEARVERREARGAARCGRLRHGAAVGTLGASVLLGMPYGPLAAAGVRAEVATPLLLLLCAASGAAVAALCAGRSGGRGAVLLRAAGSAAQSAPAR